jgi:putative tricarboxylic transport membrane protein
MFDAMASAFAVFATVEHLGYLSLGVVLGLMVGAFPGLGGIAGLALLLPFLYGLDVVSGLAMMVGLVAVIPTSDTFTSVLMGIPGSSSSQATVLDGFPLARRGEGARALGAAFVSSLFGGLLGAVLLTFFIVIARPIILTFRTPELLMLTILGFSMVCILAGRSLVKGLAATGLGMLVSSIGAAPAQGSERMLFGIDYLYDGLQLVIVGLGIFAIPEIVTLLRHDKPISREAVLGHGWLQGVVDWWQNLFLSVRCALIGVMVGVIPGLGGSVVDWIAYAHLVQSTRRRDRLGKGDIRGVIAPESANNAKEGGGLVPTLLFGIPGSGSMAIFLGGMVLLGIEAGPAMVGSDLDTTYTIVWSLALANVLGAGLCLFLSPAIAQLTRVRFPLIAPFMLMFITFAAFQSRQSVWDLAALAVIGVLALHMKRFDWPRPAFLIGFVLADSAEVYTYQATQFTMYRGLDYLLSPTVYVLVALTVASLVVGVRQAKHIARGNPDVSAAERIDRRAEVLFALLIAAFAAVAIVDVAPIRALIDKVFPLAVALFTLPAALLVVVQLLVTGKRHPVHWDGEVQGANANDPLRLNMWRAFSWYALLLAATALAGFLIANALFFLSFLRLRARASWPAAVLLTAIATGLILVLAHVLHRDFPPGLLQAVVELPWPLR